MQHTLKATTIIAICRDNRAVMCCDGQVSYNDMIIKHTVKKIRALSEHVIAGFSGSTADAMNMLNHLSQSLVHYPDINRACVNLMAQRLNSDACILLASRQKVVMITGRGDLLEPDDGVMAIGSGAGYALSSARSLLRYTKLSITSIAQKSILIASELCPHTNANVETLCIADENSKTR